MRRCYSGLLRLLLPFILIRLAWQALRNPAYAERWRERLGWYKADPRLERPLWVHAVSVGEVTAAAPLIRALRERYPERDLLITTTTPTGYATVVRLFGETVHHAYFPYDLPSAVRRFWHRFQPSLLLLMETELWPNAIHELRRRGVPVMLANARLSARSARSYARYGRFVRTVLCELSQVAAQTQADAERLCALGLPPVRVTVTGSLKFDILPPASLVEEGESVRRELGETRLIVMAGSTRPGEEALLLKALRLLRHRLPAVLMVIAPRHPERFEEVAELLRREGWHFQRRREHQPCAADTEVFLIDGMGELLRFYAACDVAFVGGSLEPFGGHNVLEPAMLGVPVVTGPHLFNFADIASRLEQAGGLRIAHDAEELADAFASWLQDSNARDQAGRAGSKVVADNRGATSAVMRLIEPLLSG